MDNINKLSNLLLNNENIKFQEIEIDKILLDESQPRKNIEDSKLNELAQSIISYGVLTPISVSKIDDEFFKLRHGERRLRASMIAGKNTIPAIIDDNYENDKLIKQLIENIQRESLTLEEISNAISILSKTMKLNQIASALGKSNAYVSNYHTYNTCKSELKELIHDKTNDINVISELIRLENNIKKEDVDNEIKTLIHNEFYKYIKNKETLNRNSPKEIKNILDNIKDTYKKVDNIDIKYENNTELYEDEVNDSLQDSNHNINDFKCNIEINNNELYLHNNGKSELLLTIHSSLIDENIINKLIKILKQI